MSEAPSPPPARPARWQQLKSYADLSADAITSILSDMKPIPIAAEEQQEPLVSLSNMLRPFKGKIYDVIEVAFTITTSCKDILRRTSREDKAFVGRKHPGGKTELLDREIADPYPEHLRAQKRVVPRRELRAAGMLEKTKPKENRLPPSKKAQRPALGSGPGQADGLVGSGTSRLSTHFPSIMPDMNRIERGTLDRPKTGTREGQGSTNEALPPMGSRQSKVGAFRQEKDVVHDFGRWSLPGNDASAFAREGQQGLHSGRGQGTALQSTSLSKAGLEVEDKQQAAELDYPSLPEGHIFTTAQRSDNEGSAQAGPSEAKIPMDGKPTKYAKKRSGPLVIDCKEWLKDGRFGISLQPIDMDEDQGPTPADWSSIFIPRSAIDLEQIAEPIWRPKITDEDMQVICPPVPATFIPKPVNEDIAQVGRGVLEAQQKAKKADIRPRWRTIQDYEAEQALLHPAPSLDEGKKNKVATGKGKGKGSDAKKKKSKPNQPDPVREEQAVDELDDTDEDAHDPIVCDPPPTDSSSKQKTLLISHARDKAKTNKDKLTKLTAITTVNEQSLEEIAKAKLAQMQKNLAMSSRIDHPAHRELRHE